MNITKKKQFVKLYSRGRFGNASPTWNSVIHMMEDFDNSYPLLNNTNQLWHIRNRIAGGKTWYDVKGEDLPDKWFEACDIVGEKNLYISAMAPTNKTVIQGEVQQTEKGITLTWTHIKKPMREALSAFTSMSYGLEAVNLLKRHMCPTSWDWLQELLSMYPCHVVEFSTYSVNWGTVPNVNTVWWEIRNY